MIEGGRRRAGIHCFTSKNKLYLATACAINRQSPHPSDAVLWDPSSLPSAGSVWPSETG